MRIAKQLSRFALMGGAAVLAFGLTGCIDDKYDLSDIDSTVRVNVNDLVLPVKMAPVELRNVISADASDDTESTSNFRYNVATGEYYIQTDGEFDAEEITIDGIYVDALTPELRTLDTPVAPGTENLADIPGINLEDFNYDFVYEFNEVDEYIEDIDIATVDLTISLTAECSLPGVTLTDMQFHFPAGLVGTPVADNGRYETRYDIESGLLTVFGTYQKMHLVFPVEQIYLHNAGGSFNRELSTFRFENNLGLRDAKITSSTAQASVTVSLGYNLSSLEVTAVTGVISYDDVKIDDTNISLEDLPKELRQSGTDLSLVNPQIYFTVTNPLDVYGLYAETGIEIYQVRGRVPESDFAASVSDVKVGYNPETEMPVHEQTICLAPTRPEYPIQGYTNFQTFNGLGSIVAGDGLPNELQVHFVNPRVPEHTAVENFPIGRTLNQKVTGSYMLYAPLALGANSTICYTDEDRNWDIENADDLHIDLLQITADVTSELPLTVELSAVPLDKNGDPIDPDKVHVEPATIPAQSTSPVEIRVTGDIVGIDGVRYTARVIADESEMPLVRTMKLKLDNLRAKVNGYYESKL